MAALHQVGPVRTLRHHGSRTFKPVGSSCFVRQCGSPAGGAGGDSVPSQEQSQRRPTRGGSEWPTAGIQVGAVLSF